MENQVTETEVPQKTLKDLSVIELKSVAYDLLAQIELTQKQFQEVNAMIAEKSK